MYIYRGTFVQPLLQSKINKNYKFWVCVCSLRYRSGNAHASYCRLWAARPYSIFSTLSHKQHGFIKKIEHKMCVLILCTIVIWNVSHSKKNWAKSDHKCILVFTWSTRYSCQILMKLEIPSQMFEKILKYEISWKSIQFQPSCFMRAGGRIWS